MVVELAQVVVVLPVVQSRENTASCELWQILQEEQIKARVKLWSEFELQSENLLNEEEY